MAGWPKTIYIRGVGIPVESWEELDELIDRYGGDVSIVVQRSEGEQGPKKSPDKPSTLTHQDRTLLQQFVEEGERGVVTRQIGPALGKRGKGIRPALEAWSRRIGLVTEEGASAFEPVKRAEGRGFRLVDVYLRTGRSMLGS